MEFRRLLFRSDFPHNLRVEREAVTAKGETRRWLGLEYTEGDVQGIADAVAVAFAKAGFAGSEPVINEDGTQRLTFSKDGYGRVMATVRSSDGQKFTNPDAKGVVWLDLQIGRASCRERVCQYV